MHWCVTDAQLAALRATAAEAAWVDYRVTLLAHADQAAQEIARVRADRDAEVARLRDPSAPFVAHLLELVAILRRDVVHERQRAEVAIDQCRATHLGIGPVTLPPRPETAAEGPRGANPFADPELASMGDPIGL